MRRRSSLEGRLRPGRSGRAEGEPGVLLREVGGLRILELAGAVADAGRLAAAVAALGLRLPAPGGATENGENRLLWRVPDTWYLLTPEDGAAERLRESLPEAVTELTGGFAVLELRGPSAGDLLAKGLPLDLDDPRHAPGSAFTSRIGKVGVTLHRFAEDGLLLLVPRSLAVFFLEWLEAAAAEFGLEVRC